MPLRDAMIDDSGCAYGRGGIAFPADPAGVFTPREPDLVRVAVRGPRDIDLVACSAKRDPATGYLIPDETPWRVILPSGLVPIVLSAIKPASDAPTITFALDYMGWLLDDSGASRVRQGLSDWRGSISQSAQGVVVRLSAALRGISRPQPWPREDDLWMKDQRIEVEFTLDLMTAVVRFGGYSNALESAYERNAAPVSRTTAGAMRLEATPVGYNGSVYGVRDGHWVSFFESPNDPRRSLSLSATRNIRRDARGMLDGARAAPFLRFSGVDLDVVAAHVRLRNVFGVTLTEGDIGSVTWDSTPGEPSLWSTMLEARLRFELTASGLIVSYNVLPSVPGYEASDEPYASDPAAPPRWPASEAHRLQNAVTIPWEGLILRSPLFAEYRGNLRDRG